MAKISPRDVTRNDTFALIWLDRSRRRWRLLAVLAALLVLLFGAWSCRDWKDDVAPADHIAVIKFEGVIMDDAYARTVIDQLADEGSVKAVLVNIDSPGGTMVGGLRYYDHLRRLAEKKPVATVMGTMAASAGYLISLAGDRIYANPASLTGSIGVLLPLVDVTPLAEKIGIREDSITSGELKEVTSPLTRRSPYARQYLQEIVDRMDGVFMALVKTRRPTASAATLRAIADGRALAGVQAFDMKLVDELGNEADAQKWLSSKLGHKEALELRDYELTEPKGWLASSLEGRLSLSGLVGQALGLPQARSAVWALAR